ncbi:MAG: mannitol-1-phosphate 5-dehydrogenase, partial [Candidatus Marinimicrobia bacterium]|nr:mannitol-1-phosphate 5-dehydrogenase [Candidatus Neomarinimicrobiota bacterium]
MNTKKLVQFGAGNIGRSFIGQLFGRAGYEVVFVDVAPDLVAALNEAGRYRVIVKQSGAADQTLWVAGVRAVNGREPDRVAAELADADLACTAVGAGALRYIWPVLARGLTARAAAHAKPLDVIFAENERDVAAQARVALQAELGPDFPLDQAAGLVESSIGKMVPIIRAEDLAQDPLWVFAEPYNTLILDRRGFRNGVPPVPGIKAVDNIRAYVDRKLFVHNLGHAAAAYLGQQADAGLTYI